MKNSAKQQARHRWRCRWRCRRSQRSRQRAGLRPGASTVPSRRSCGCRDAPHMPRFRFENFTTANGLPDNHVFSVLVDGDRIWAGTDNGLGLYENRQMEDVYDEGWPGAPRRAFAGAGQAHRRRVGRHHGRAEPHLRRAHRQLHAAELRPQQRRGLRRFRRRRERVGGHRRRRLPPQPAHRRVVALQRAQHADARDLGLRSFRRARQSLLRRVGQRPAGVRPEDRRAGTSTTTPTAKPKWCCSRIRA